MAKLLTSVEVCEAVGIARGSLGYWTRQAGIEPADKSTDGNVLLILWSRDTPKKIRVAMKAPGRRKIKR